MLHSLDGPNVRARLIGIVGALLLVAATQAVAYAGEGGMGDAIANLAKMLIDGIIALAVEGRTALEREGHRVWELADILSLGREKTAKARRGQ